jgi:hypothetical protein
VGHYWRTHDRRSHTLSEFNTPQLDEDFGRHMNDNPLAGHLTRLQPRSIMETSRARSVERGLAKPRRERL